MSADNAAVSMLAGSPHAELVNFAVGIRGHDIRWERPAFVGLERDVFLFEAVRQEDFRAGILGRDKPARRDDFKIGVAGGSP